MTLVLSMDLVTGVDFHVQNMCWGKVYPMRKGSRLAKIEELPEWKKRRPQAKPISFGEAYGQMPESMSERTGTVTDRRDL